MSRKFIHIDLDYFFAQVEELEHPEIKNKPVAVGGENINRSVVSTCNYIARKSGIHSGMPLITALRNCPELIILPVRMHKYEAVSKAIRSLLYSITDLVEFASLDEAYLDVTNVMDFDNSATLIARHIKKEIFNKTGLTASAGVAPNMLLAKIASGINKPDGLYVISPNNVKEFIYSLPVSNLYGVGAQMLNRLKKMNVLYCNDLYIYTQKELQNHFGKFGLQLYNYCRGLDFRAINNNRIRKSISIEKTFAVDLTKEEACYEQLSIMYNEFLTKIDKSANDRISALFIKTTSDKFEKYISTRKSFSHSMDLFCRLFKIHYSKYNNPLRLIGIGVRLNQCANNQLPLWS